MLSSTLNDTIDRELGWREAEMALIKAQLLRDVLEDGRFRCTYRAFVAITYAHYEAFSKILIAQSVSDIANCGITQSKCVNTIQERLFAANARRQLNTISNAELIATLNSAQSLVDAIPFPSDDRFMSISNLNVPNFRELVSCVGLSWDDFVDHRHTVGRLVDLRHRCAHGEKVDFDSSKTNQEIADELFRIQASILTVMHLLATKLVDLFEQRLFEAGKVGARGS